MNETLSLDLTLGSGQVFRWRKIDDSWLGPIKGSAVLLRCNKNVLEFRSNPELKEDDIRWFFMLDLDYRRVLDTFPKDQITQSIMKKYNGLRIVRQEPWDCFIAYIISSGISIIAIESVLDRLSASSSSICENDYCIRLIPQPNELLNMKRPTAKFLGRKWTYLVDFAKRIVNGSLDFEVIRKQSYQDAWSALLYGKSHIKGIGPKVADCVLLFAFEKMEAFPIDRWVFRGLAKYYPSLIDVNPKKTGLTVKGYERVSEKARNYFGHYAGIYQEFLFEHMRSGSDLS
ncbi:MAG: DNA glycosylase [Nitrososphaerota archaeon]